VHTETHGAVRTPPSHVGAARTVSDRDRDRIILWLAVVLIAAFGLFNLIGLDRFPLVHQDESWIAEPGYRFWQHGRFMSELYTGLFGAERYYMLHAPLFSLMTGAAVYFGGWGLLPVRLVSLAMAVAAAALTYRLGRRLLSPLHGLLAMLVVTMMPLVPGLPSRPSGIPFVDLGRLSRYDLAVAVFGLAGYLLILPWLLARGGADAVRWRRTRFLLGGACAGLALTCHATGVIWIVLLGVACLVTAPARGWRPAIAAAGWCAAGTIVALLPWLWLLYVGREELIAQQRFHAVRYDLFHLRFYLTNLIEEWRRYGTIGRGLLAVQPGSWLFILGSIAGVWTMFAGARRHEPGATQLRAGLIVCVGLCALGLQPKSYNYLGAIWPWLALTAACGIAAALQSASGPVWIGAVALLISACTDGAISQAHVARQALRATPYTALCDRLATQISPGMKVLALPHYWLGLMPRVRGYQSLLVPIVRMAPAFYDLEGETMESLLTTIDADVVILDPPMLDYLRQSEDASDPSHAFTRAADGLRAFLATHTVRRADLDDPSYGHIELYFLR
jgi:4-amino-4-deoxy-L-arabinose transferase-like glycosyltransferase